jgi:putative transposase
MAVLYCPSVSTWATIAEALAGASHDGLTRMLHGRWSGPILLAYALRALFAVGGGDLIVDDTVGEKPYARLLGEAAWGWSSQQRNVVFGISVVFLVWTDGQRRLPLAFRVWTKAGASKFALARELLSYAGHRRRCKPQLVLFDSW